MARRDGGSIGFDVLDVECLPSEEESRPMFIFIWLFWYYVHSFRDRLHETYSEQA